MERHPLARPSHPEPADAENSGLFAVSCASPRACTATGAYVTRHDHTVTLTEAWNGTRWRIQTTPEPADAAGAVLPGVSCTSPQTCTATGYDVNIAGGALTLAEAWNGRRWRIQATPSPAGAAVFSNFHAASCTSPRSCTATGDYTNSAGTTVTLAEYRTGAHWRIQATPDPAGAISSSLSAVSCTSPRSCTATGDYTTRPGGSLTLAESWNGTRWRIQATPNPAGAIFSSLSAVSCTSPRSGTATGDYTKTRGGFGLPLAERWNGTSWRIQESPLPAGAASGALSGVSCTSAHACTAAGAYEKSGGEAQLLAESWNGTSWHIQATPGPAGSLGGGFSAVSCTSPRACTAAGTNFTSTGGIVTLADRWNGKTWRAQATPNPPGAQGGEAVFHGVSCTSNRACTAVGEFTTSDFTPPTAFAETWNGTRWSLQIPPSPAGTTSSVLNGMSCTSPRACTAAGYRFGIAGIQVTLAVTTSHRATPAR